MLLARAAIKLDVYCDNRDDRVVLIPIGHSQQLCIYIYIYIYIYSCENIVR